MCDFLIRSRVVHHRGRPRSILISSPGVGDGKTTTATGLAWALALRERAETLLLDGDLRRSALTKEFGLSGRPGLTEVLRGSSVMTDALVTCGENPNLYVLGSGVHRANVTELLDTPQCQEWTETARSVFDYIVIDAPPVAAVADYELLQRLVDGVILIARPGFTNRGSLLTALSSVPSELLLGVVVNFARDWPFWEAPHRYYNYAGTAE